MSHQIIIKPSGHLYTAQEDETILESALREGFALLLQFSERIENGQLPRRVQQRLMVMRPVDVHQPFANRAERLQRGG